MNGNGADIRRFLSLVTKTHGGCWIWRAAISWNGYGFFKIARKMVGAHRASWTMFRGKIPDGMMILHKCDNPPCVNPGHLFVGTQRDNHRDMVLKGRGINGEKNGRHKLNRLQVSIIRKTAGVSQQYLADLFGVSQAAISSIQRGKTWR